MRPALLCLESRGRVVHARRLELREPRHVELPVPRAGGDDHGPCCDLDVHLGANQVMAIRRCNWRASLGMVMRAPNLRAWIAARSASSAPEIPAGKPR